MFKFSERMIVIVNRNESLKSKEVVYHKKYPTVGWVGRLLHISDREEKEWAVEWYENFNGEQVANDFGGDLVREWMIAPHISNYGDLNFTVGDKVIYTSGRYDDSKSNPLWNGKMGQIYGIINKIHNSEIFVNWVGDFINKKNLLYVSKQIWNVFLYKDLLPLKIFETPPKRNIKRHIDDLCNHLYSYDGKEERQDVGGPPRRRFGQISESYSISNSSSRSY